MATGVRSQYLVEMNVLIRTSCNQTQSDSHFHCWILSWFEFEFVCSSLLSPFPACFFPFICVSGVNHPCVFLSFFLVCLFCSSPVSPVFLPVFPVLLWFVLYFYVFIVLQLSDLSMPALCVFLPSAFFFMASLDPQITVYFIKSWLLFCYLHALCVLSSSPFFVTVKTSFFLP